MLVISNPRVRAMHFKRDRNFIDIYKPDQLIDVNTEEHTCTKRRKVGNLNLQTTFSSNHLASKYSSSKGEVEDLFNKQLQQLIIFSAKSSTEFDVAATKLQKVYKSYRTRRNLADCAVICEELWWQASKFPTSQFDSDVSEAAISKWARARTMAAKVGNGLSKDDKAKKLALRHWLEAIDPRHRYGHNLHFYYDVWFLSQSSQPFFYWLDVGDGKEVNLDICPRKDLQRQIITYLGPEEREAYEVIVEGGRLVYRQSKELVHTTEGSKWIFVLSSSRVLYIGQKKKGQFQHSSFLAGAATIASGRLVAHHGVLDAIWPYSGHYRPTEKNFVEFICFLEEHYVDLTNVKKYPVDDDVPLSNIEGNNVGSSDDPAITNHYDQQNGSNMEGSIRGSKPMSSKWTTGVGPRIGCLGEYPRDLQRLALHHLKLLPRTVNHETTMEDIKSTIPSPRHSPKVYLSPRLVSMGFPSPRGVFNIKLIQLKLKKFSEKIENQINQKTEKLKILELQKNYLAWINF